MIRALIAFVLAAGFALAAGTFPLDSAVNLAQFQLSPVERDLLTKNGFVVSPSSLEQLFQQYVDNWWDSVPSFVTSDLMLQLFHLTVGSTLRRIEEERLYYRLVDFSQSMSRKFDASDRPRLSAYFGVACRLLGVDVRLPPDADSLCDAEFSLIDGQSGRAISAIFPFMLDYSLFRPRGHYTRNDTLGRYFRAMMWYGLAPFPLLDSLVTEEDRLALTQDAMRISLALADDESLRQLWHDIYDITSYFSGPSESYTPDEYVTVLSTMGTGGVGDYRSWTVPFDGFLDSLADGLVRLRAPRIRQVAEGIPTGLQFRLFGRRYVPDTDIMQRLVDWPNRPFPKGLDVLAALGSGRAEHILTEVYREQDHWPGYLDNLANVQADFRERDSSFWYQNVYFAWLYALQALTEPVPDKAPPFAKTEAWQDKSLNTSLGSWSELRHDAVLYAEGTLAEAGAPFNARGYVEPNPGFFRRLLRAVDVMESRLSERHLESDSLKDDLQWFRQTLQVLITVAGKELDRIPPTEDELSEIWDIGNTVEGISCRIAGVGLQRWFEQAQGTDRFMACIADVATSLEQCLEVGVAAGSSIYVLVPIEGKWTLTRGAVFSYREFLHPVSDRLTDEKWQQMVRNGKAPLPPAWTSSFTAAP